MSHRMASNNASSTNHPNADPFAVPSGHSDTNLFFRRLPPAVDDTELRRLFEPFGKIVSAAVMRDIHTGDSLGTAFVRFAEHGPALEVMKRFVNTPLAGGSRALIIQWAKRQHDDAIMGAAREHIRKLFIRNIPVGVTEEQLYELMRGFGEVEQVTLHTDTAPPASSRHAPRSHLHPDGQSPPVVERLIAFVTFGEDHAAAKACDGVHNTCPFSFEGDIPLMTKLAEDNRQRHARRGSAAHHGRFHRGNGSPNTSCHSPNRSYAGSGTSMNAYGFSCSGSGSILNASPASSHGCHLSPPRNGPASLAMAGSPYLAAGSASTTQVPDLSQLAYASHTSEIVDMSFGVGPNGPSPHHDDYAVERLDSAMYPRGGVHGCGGSRTAHPVALGVEIACGAAAGHSQGLPMPRLHGGGSDGGSHNSSLLSQSASAYLSKGSRGHGSMNSSRAGTSTGSSRYRYNPYNPVNPREVIM